MDDSKPVIDALSNDGSNRPQPNALTILIIALYVIAGVTLLVAAWRYQNLSAEIEKDGESLHQQQRRESERLLDDYEYRQNGRFRSPETELEWWQKELAPLPSSTPTK